MVPRTTMFQCSIKTIQKFLDWEKKKVLSKPTQTSGCSYCFSNKRQSLWCCDSSVQICHSDFSLQKKRQICFIFFWFVCLLLGLNNFFLSCELYVHQSKRKEWTKSTLCMLHIVNIFLFFTSLAVLTFLKLEFCS